MCAVSSAISGVCADENRNEGDSREEADWASDELCLSRVCTQRARRAVTPSYSRVCSCALKQEGCNGDVAFHCTASHVCGGEREEWRRVWERRRSGKEEGGEARGHRPVRQTRSAFMGAQCAGGDMERWKREAGRFTLDAETAVAR